MRMNPDSALVSTRIGCPHRSPACSGLEIFLGTYSSCGASGLKFSLVLTPVELVLKNISNRKIENNHMICRINNTKLCYP